MKRVLFQPFDLGKWFMLGFSAWLATLGENGGGGFNGSLGDLGEKSSGEGGEDSWANVVAFFHEHMLAVITIGGAVLLFSIALGLVAAWAHARGKFMYIDNLIHNRALVSQPWEEHRVQGNSLFLWNVCVGLLALPFAGLILAPLAIHFIQLHGAKPEFGGLLGPILLTVLGALLLAILFGLLGFLTNEFIVPVMKKRGLKAVAAWKLALPQMRAVAGSIFLYILLRIALAMAIGATLMMLGFLTCCCGFIILAIPYINAVAQLPATAFVRFYNLEFVRQIGPDFDLLSSEPPSLEPAAQAA